MKIRLVSFTTSYLCFLSLAALSYEQQMMTDFFQYARLDDAIQQELFALASVESTPKKFSLDTLIQLPLFNAYPALQEHIPYIKLGGMPTPLHHCKALGSMFKKTQVYIKCDNATSGTCNGQKLFGGNKVRKLEFLLADAVAQGARSVVTFGCAGSNHALATAAYAQHLGLESHLFLVDQHNSHVVQRNLLLDAYHNAKLVHAETKRDRFKLAAQFCKQHKGQFCSFPYIIPLGGSCARGIVGFVNAAFELKEQIDAGLLPEPKYIIVACGSYGTAAGLMLGCKAAGLQSIIVPVAVEPDDAAGEIEEGIAQRFNDTAVLLAEYEPAFARYSLKPQDVQVVHAFEGSEYALFIPEAMEALKALKKAEGITLDGVYSAKAACALFSWLTHSKQDEPILFWNTFCADSFEELTSIVDYKNLPMEFHKYFTEDVQELDT